MAKRKKPLKPGPHPDGSYVLDCTPPKLSKLRPDVAQTAYRTMLEATGQAPKTRPGEGPRNPEAVARGRKGGKKGGAARAAKLTERQRAEIAHIASTARWKKTRD